MIFCFISVKIKKSRNDSWTITSVYQFPLLINFKDCYLWPNRLWVEYHVIHVLYGSKFRHPSLSIFVENIFVRFLNLKRLYWLIIDDMIGWQKAGRSDPTESDWVIISQWLPYFWKKKGILSIQNEFLVISGLNLTLKIPLSRVTFSPPDNLNFFNW